MNQRSLCKTATELTGDRLFKKLSLLSICVIVAANLLSLLSQTLINSLMSDAVGLSALGKRSALLTVQTAVQLAITLGLPFWGYGFYKVAMYAARKATPDSKTLLWGFRRFFPLLRLLVLEFLIAMGYTMLASLGASMLYMMTPLAEKALNDVSPALMQAEALINDPEALNALMIPVMQDLLQKLWPMYLLLMIALGALLIPWLYKLRLAPYLILDGENSALKAMAISQQQMYGHKFAFFKLDLCWWWYYGLLVLATLPISISAYLDNEALFWTLTLVSFGLQILVQWQLLPRVQTSYALAYDQLKKETPQQ